MPICIIADGAIIFGALIEPSEVNMHNRMLAMVTAMTATVPLGLLLELYGETTKEYPRPEPFRQRPGLGRPLLPGDVVGLYVDPPAHAVVLSVDEKSQIQALDRTQPGLPMKPGRAGTMTHDYKRNGTTTLFAALNVLDGTIIGHNMKRHRHQEFIRFLNEIDALVPKRKAIHAIVDNYATHKHPKVRKWLARYPRWTFHFTPTSASWLNAVEGFVAKLTNRRLKRGAFRSVAELQAAIERFIAEANADPKPFMWTARPNRILAAVKRGKQTLESV